MCGIFAILKGYKYCPVLSRSKCDSLARRGPDNSSSLISDDFLFYFYRLAIMDNTAAGNQPMTSGSISLMCNGEIYNYKQLKQEYNLECKSGSDCEVILKLFEKFLINSDNNIDNNIDNAFVSVINKLYGVFAIVIHYNNTFYVARDRIGVRPLWIGKIDNTAIISSTVNSLIGCKDIEPILPGGCAKVTRPFGSHYYIHLETPIIPVIRDTTIDIIRKNLIEAVDIRLMADRPMGCLLSGGLDSSLIAAILCRLAKPENIRTYSIGMEGATDLIYARKVAAYLGTKHTEVIFTPEEGCAILPEVIEALGSYDITTIRASVGMYLLSKYISENTQDKVIFTGEGSDEIFCGYLYFHLAPSLKEGENESLRLIRELHLYDVLRCDRCISSNGLEPRVPFLDKKVVDCALALPAVDKLPVKGIEKYILRQAFLGYLPEEVLMRRKEGFSDGVSDMKKPWYIYIQEYVDNKIPEECFDNITYPSKEAQYYRLIFNKKFPGYNPKINYWMPKWSNVKDPSGRLISVNSQSTTKD